MEIERVKGKIMEGQPGFPRQYGPSRSDHQPGIPFFPQETARDFVLIFLLTALLFFLSAFVTPFLGPARSPQISELIVPDWYLLFSWGLLKVADVFPQFVIGAGTPLKTDFNAAFWGDLLSGIPVIFLLILPFIDRGREARPAKSPVRSAFGVAFLLAWIFTASLYSIRGRGLRRIRSARRVLHELGPTEPRRLHMGPVRALSEHEHPRAHADVRRAHRVPGGPPTVQHVRVPPERVLSVRQVPYRVPRNESRGRRPGRPEPRLQHVQEAARRRPPVDVPRV